jgi:Na+-transporting NADH:ubiquinone oxidoreductase subunit NqrE
MIFNASFLQLCEIAYFKANLSTHQKVGIYCVVIDCNCAIINQGYFLAEMSPILPF